VPPPAAKSMMGGMTRTRTHVYVYRSFYSGSDRSALPPLQDFAVKFGRHTRTKEHNHGGTTMSEKKESNPNDSHLSPAKDAPAG
jgi:hypothetical protein